MACITARGSGHIVVWPHRVRVARGGAGDGEHECSGEMFVDVDCMLHIKSDGTRLDVILAVKIPLTDDVLHCTRNLPSPGDIPA